MQIVVLEARLLFPTGEVLQQMDDSPDQRTGLGRVAMRTMLDQLNARTAGYKPGDNSFLFAQIQITRIPLDPCSA